MQTVTKGELEWILISDKTDIKTIIVTRHKEGHYIMIKGSIHQGNINTYTANNRAPKYVTQKLIEQKG